MLKTKMSKAFIVASCLVTLLGMASITEAAPPPIEHRRPPMVGEHVRRPRPHHHHHHHYHRHHECKWCGATW